MCKMVSTHALFVVAILAAGVKEAAAYDDTLRIIRLHGWLMWASMGFLLPLGAILIRFNPRTQPNANAAPTRVSLFYLHVIIQCAGVCLAIAGVGIAFKKFGDSFNHTHQKLGLALFSIVILMPFIGIMRPAKGKALRSYWLFAHWLLGTTLILLGILNCFIGIAMYQFHIASIHTLKVAFSVQVAIMAFIYFLQDRWSYIVAQGSVESFMSKVAGHPI